MGRLESVETRTRQQAKSLGLATYFTGKPCIRNGIAERRTDYGSCGCEACRQHRSAISRQWYATDPKAVIEKKRAYVAKNKEEVAARKKQYVEKNKSKISEYRKHYLQSLNADQRRARDESNARYVAKNLEAVKLWQLLYRQARRQEAIRRVKAWMKSNPGRHRQNTAARRAAEIKRRAAWFGEFDAFVVEESEHLRLLRQEMTGIRWHIDHMLPLRARSVSGLHCGLNLQVIPEVLNRYKANTLRFTEFAEWIEAL